MHKTFVQLVSGRHEVRWLGTSRHRCWDNFKIDPVVKECVWMQIAEVSVKWRTEFLD
jgi:hypothetical protein